MIRMMPNGLVTFCCHSNDISFAGADFLNIPVKSTQRTTAIAHKLLRKPGPMSASLRHITPTI